MAYVLGLVLLLCPLVPCYGFCFVLGGTCPLSWYDAGDFGPDLVMVGIFVIARCNSIWPMLWACFVAMRPGPLLWFLFCVWCCWFLVVVPVCDISGWILSWGVYL